MTNNDDGSRAHAAHSSGDVRANNAETFANLTHLPHLPHLPHLTEKNSSGYELHPTSSTSTRASVTVDGHRTNPKAPAVTDPVEVEWLRAEGRQR